MKFLITGATGFIGRNMVSFLVQKGHSVQILVLEKEVPGFLIHPQIEVRFGDLTKPETLEGLGENCEIVIHLAAKVLDWGSKKSFYSVIYQGTQHLLEATFRKINRFVFVSSIAATGVNRNLGGEDESVTSLLTGIHYGDAKLKTEELVKEYSRSYNIPATIIRPGNVIGPGSVWVDESISVMKSLTGMPLIDQGKHPCAAIDVENLVNGIYLAATLPQAVSQTYFMIDDWEVSWKEYLEDLGKIVGAKPRGNLSFGFAYAMGGLFEKMYRPLGLRPPLTRLGASLVGRNLMFNTTKAKSELGWESKVTYQESMNRIRNSILNKKDKVIA